MKLSNEIIRQLYYADTLSIAELSLCTEKSIPKVTDEVSGLVAAGVLQESGLAASTGGRRAMKHGLVAENLPFILTISVDQFFTAIAVVDVKHQFVITSRQVATQIHEDETAFDTIITVAKQVREELPSGASCIVGLTMPGFVDSEKGVNHSFPITSPFYEIKKNVESALGLPTSVANDSSAIAIAEHKFNKNNHANQDILVINFNWGVGLGMIIGGQLYTGHSGYAGEFSHIPLANSYKLCSCGKKGCLEVEASILAVMENVHNALADGEPSFLQQVLDRQAHILFSDVVRAFELGDQVALKAVSKSMHMLGKGLSTLIHIMNPERIIMSGKAGIFGEALLPALHSSIQEYCIPRLLRFTTVSISDTQNIQTIAAACTAVQQTTLIQPQITQLNLQQL
ncbi:ROK family protein [Sphingobacterium oryzagri]|uniref:ROK family protein n=1 Tax=Sphingobacterium oryzagri TaxID=3025669 RepID=A0ABY7WFB0_9SPHI|nr:ROK family protein [Sphingobacterium sp. KACC 22765]WDF68195.1 ROK family protein [Sphingobacterium sp. KACC 22765]